VVVNDLGGEWDGQGADPRQAQVVADEIVASGGKAVANFGSVASTEDAQAMVVQAVDAFGRLDILVNNAGILRDRMVFNLDSEDILAILQVHVMGHFNTIRHAATHWREVSKAGETVNARIINTSSASGVFGNIGQTNYGAAKAAIASITQIAAMELARYGVTVNAICPTARTRLTMMGSRVIGGVDPSTVAWDPLDPANVAPMVAFLASDASAEITGHVFGVVGGEVQLYEGWSLGPKLKVEDRGLTLGELTQRWEELFAGDRPKAFRSPLEDLRPDLQAMLARAGLSD